MVAARWLESHYGMAVDSHNLSDLIENYDIYHELYDKPVLISSLEIKKGRFNPFQLNDFFKFAYSDEELAED